MPTRRANERYVDALARIVYDGAYPAVHASGRTSSWAVMKVAGGATICLFPGAPKNMMTFLDDHISPVQRKVLTPNTDRIYAASFVDPTDIYVDDFYEPIHFIGGTDDKGARRQARDRYIVTFPKRALPPADRHRGGFWSLTMYDRDYTCSRGVNERTSARSTSTSTS